MKSSEIRDPAAARRHLLQSLWLVRLRPPDAATLTATLDWAMELASEDQPIPLLGFVSDVGFAATTMVSSDHSGQSVPPGIDSTALRQYEDYVLGRLWTDISFERGADALLRYQGRDRTRCTAFLIQQLCRRAGIDGVLVVPSVIKQLQQQVESSLEDLRGEAWELWEHEDSYGEISDELQRIIAAVRNTGELLGAEDVFELEHGTALAHFGQRLAVRQVVKAADELCRQLPSEPLRPVVRREQVATNITHDDMYPVGGYTSISTKGTMESLLHSQLAYMDQDQRPDLFDIKFLRDELYYYSRDDNQFFRRRQHFIFALYPDLEQARYKDADLPWQRIVLVLALLAAVVETLSRWLSDDALTFEFLLLESNSSPHLSQEGELLEMLLREPIAAGMVSVQALAMNQLRTHCEMAGKRVHTEVLQVSAAEQNAALQFCRSGELLVRGSEPEWAFDGEKFTPDESGMAAWAELLRSALRHWM